MEHPYNPPKTDQALCQAIQENIAYIQTFPPQRLMVMLQPSLLEASLAERTARFQYPIQDWMLNAVNIVGSEMCIRDRSTAGPSAASSTTAWPCFCAAIPTEIAAP